MFMSGFAKSLQTILPRHFVRNNVRSYLVSAMPVLLEKTVGVNASSYLYQQSRDASSTSFTRTRRILELNNLSHIPGSRKKRKRRGRGVGSGMGKNCGRGHQQKGRTPRGFEGGQTPLFKTLPKIGFHNHNHRDLQVLNIDKLVEQIAMGRLKPSADRLTTMRDLLVTGCVDRVKDGIKLLGRNKSGLELKEKIHLEVSFASREAIEAIEKAGGTVTCAHFNRLSLRALLKPYKFDLLPRRARPNPKIMDYYLDVDKAGYLSPEIQKRNLELFGSVTSEDALRVEHDNLMAMRRAKFEQSRQIYYTPRKKRPPPPPPRPLRFELAASQSSSE